MMMRGSTAAIAAVRRGLTAGQAASVGGVRSFAALGGAPPVAGTPRSAGVRAAPWAPRLADVPVWNAGAAALRAGPQLSSQRGLHMTHQAQSAPLIIGVGVAGLAIVARYAVQAYPAWKENRDRTKAHFRSPYKGGFEEEMTRREAALILGVRESASKDRVKKRHRELLMVNHPDRGGSTFIATKINEAKEKLTGGSA